MSAALIAAAATVIVGLLGLLGARWMSNVQGKAAENEERLSRYESWDRLYDNVREESERFKSQRDDAWAANDRLRSDNDRLAAENASLRRRVEEWISKGEHG